MLETVIGRIRGDFPDTRFCVYTYFPEEDRKAVLDETIILHSGTPWKLCVLFPLVLIVGICRRLWLSAGVRNMPASVADLVCSKVLLDISGVSFMDSRLKILPYDVLIILLGVVTGVPVVKLSQALGPMEKNLTRWSAKIWLPRCRVIFARGRQTALFLKSIDPSTIHMDSAADLCFCYQPAYSLTAQDSGALGALVEKLNQARQKKKIIVGICPSSVIAAKLKKESGQMETYILFLIELAVWLIEQEYAVLFFPNATRAGRMREWRNNDLPIIRMVEAGICQRLSGAFRQNVMSVSFDINAAGIRSLITLTDACVVSRFHAMVGALDLTVPVLVLGWSHKYLEVMESFGQAARVIDYQSYQNEDIIACLENLLAERRHIQKTIARKLPLVKEQAMRQFEFLDRLIKDRN